MSDIVITGSSLSDDGVELVLDQDIAAAKASVLANKLAAETAQTAAELAQTNAETAETNAASSASSASTSASNASTSETNAATSASTASTAATNASTSETNAATSASNASTSETNAATSETNASASETAALAAQVAAEAARDTINGSYLGVQASDPTLDLNGDPITTGDWYYNSSTNITRIYDGSIWQNGAVDTAQFVIDGDNVTFASVQYTGGTGEQGKVSWDADEETLSLIQNGNILEVGQEHQVHCRNNTVSTITKGTVVMATGTIGASGRITIAPYDNTSDVKYILGVVAYDITASADGKVTTFGKVKNLDTSLYLEGDVLYTDTAGALTKTAPTTGIKNAIAFVISVHATNGTIMVRTQSFNELAYEPKDATILKDADIGVNIQAYDANIVSDASYVHTDNNYTTTEKSKLATYPATYTTVTEW